MIRENKEEPSVRELAQRLDVSPEELATALEAGARPESIYSTPASEGKDGKALIDRLECKENYEEEIVNKLLVERLIDEFDEREKKIIILRYFKHKTQSQIAQMLGFSQVQISRIEKKVLQRMREKIS